MEGNLDPGDLRYIWLCWSHKSTFVFNNLFCVDCPCFTLDQCQSRWISWPSLHPPLSWRYTLRFSLPYPSYRALKEHCSARSGDAEIVKYLFDFFKLPFCHTHCKHSFLVVVSFHLYQPGSFCQELRVIFRLQPLCPKYVFSLPVLSVSVVQKHRHLLLLLLWYLLVLLVLLSSFTFWFYFPLLSTLHIVARIIFFKLAALPLYLKHLFTSFYP